MKSELAGYCHRVFEDADEVGELLEQVADAEFTQVSPGRFRGSTTRVDLAWAELHLTSINVKTVYRFAAREGMAALILPYSPTPMRWNGEVVDEPTLLHYDHYFSRVATNVEGVGVVYADEELRAAAAALAAVESEELVVPNGRLIAARPEIERLKSDLRGLARIAKYSPERFRSRQRRRAARDRLMGAVLDVYVSSHENGNSLGSAATSAARRRAVFRAEKYFDEAGEKPVSLADLCKAAGVSARALQYAFQELYDISPMRYFKVRRLGRARTLLRQRPAEPGAVKRAALGAGLTELGRFSVEYRELFGESPSMTLRRRTNAANIMS